MKILVLSKRFYTNKDLLRERYGRVYEFSRALAQQGHQVLGVALDYRRGTFPPPDRNGDNAQPDWRCFSLFPHPLSGLYRYVRSVRQLAEAFAPDVIVSVSDIYHVVFGDWLKRKTGCAHVVDLYDNYECFGAARVPGMKSLYRRALSRAEAIVTVSSHLKRHVQTTVGSAPEPRVILNAVDRELFRPQDRSASRQRLGLPEDAIVAGLGGTISHARGVRQLLQAHAHLLSAGHDVHLALAGAVTDGMDIPVHGKIHYLGELDYRRMPEFYSALDVGIIINRASCFARFCFPQKFFEMQACELPVVVASIGDVRDFMADCPAGLFEPGDAASLAHALQRQLADRCIAPVGIPEWTGAGSRFSDLLQEIGNTRSATDE